MCPKSAVSCSVTDRDQLGLGYTVHARVCKTLDIAIMSA